MDISKIRHPNLWAFLLLLLPTLLAYANSFSGDWFMDDMWNIVNNQAFYITSLDWASLKQAAFHTKDFTRPLASLSLALNWYWGQDRVFGYHVVNFSIHVIAAYFLFLTIKQIPLTPRMRERFADQKARIYVIAFCAALLWALHPIQIQAVTYIVQRMASMSAMFFIIGLYCFLRGRLSSRKKWRITAFVLCFLCFICALASKENALVFPCVLILVQALFFKPVTKLTGIQKMVLAVCLVIVLCVVGGMFYLYGERILIGYSLRPFTLLERLLTETRVIFLYLSQIFYPLPSHFQVDHYVRVSTSLINPLSTLAACAGIVALLVLAIVRARRWPLLSFAILFYFGCHVLESTIMPLELIFEHRNYLPSMFIGVPLVYGCMRLYDRLKAKGLFWGRLLTACGVLILVLLGLSTYMRNSVWSSQMSLYEAALERYPQLSRPYMYIGVYYYNINRPQADALALENFKKALENNYFHRSTDMERTIQLTAMTYKSMGRYDEALAFLKENAAKYPDSFAIVLAFIEVYDGMQAYSESCDVLKGFLAQEPENFQARLILGNILQDMGAFADARVQYETARTFIAAHNEQLYITLMQLGIVNINLKNFDGAATAFNEVFAGDNPAYKLQAAGLLLGLAELQNEKLPAAQMDYLQGLDRQSALAVLEGLLQIKHLPEEFKLALQTVVNANFR